MSQRLQLNRWIIGAASVVLFYVNYEVLLTRNVGVSFEKKFGTFPKGKRIALRLTAIAISLAAWLVFFLTVEVYQQMLNIEPPP